MNESTTRPPTAEQIAVCAYLIWEKEGRLHGRDTIHWLHAEKQLQADHLHDNGVLPDATESKPGRRVKGGTKRVKEFQELVT